MRRIMMIAVLGLALAQLLVVPVVAGSLMLLGAGGNGGSVVSACANGNLLLDYSDSCQLMSQMVGN